MVRSSLLLVLLILLACKDDSVKVELPIIIIGQVTNVTSSSATVAAQITFDGNGSITERGIIYGDSPNLTFTNTKIISGSGAGVFETSIGNLDPAKLYYARGYAVNSAGVSFTDEKSFKTEVGLPNLTTINVTELKTTSATSGGVILTDGGSPIELKGVVLSKLPNPTLTDTRIASGIGNGKYSSTITKLSPSTKYYLRSFATNIVGTGFGNQIEFVTSKYDILKPSLNYGSLTDVDGNIYPTIVIGTQTWMASNLKVTKFKNGETINNETDRLKWKNLSTGVWASYNNSSMNDNIYGKLYNWYAIADTRGLCPTGWHIPNDGEINSLFNFLGGQSIGGNKLKTTDDVHWMVSSSATNESGFSGLPGGMINSNSEFVNLEYTGIWATSTSSLGGFTAFWLMHDSQSVFKGGIEKYSGVSVRCKKD